MADTMSSLKRSQLMSRVRSKGNKTTESAMVSAFRKVGVKGWLRHSKVGRCRPDFAFRKEKVAIFLDGCFWHFCPIHGSVPESNVDFWSRKLKANVARDLRTNAELSSSGWFVLRFWEHSIKKDPDDCASFVMEILNFVKSLKRI